MSSALKDWYRATERELLARGYVACGSHSQNTIVFEWYRAPSSNASVVAYLAFSEKRRSRAYAIYFGFVCVGAHKLIEKAAPQLKLLLPINNFDESYVSWNLFDAGRALKWPGLLIPDPVDRSLAGKQWIEFTRDILERTVETTVTCSDVLHVLRRNDKPFEWFASSRLARATECLAIGCTLGFTAADFEEEVVAILERVPAEYQRHKLWEDVINALTS